MARTTKAKKKTRQTERTPDPVRNALVLISITVVTIAFGIGLYLQFGMAFWLAVVAALAVYLALVSAHVMIRRSETTQSLRAEIIDLRRQLAVAVDAPHAEERAQFHAPHDSFEAPRMSEAIAPSFSAHGNLAPAGANNFPTTLAPAARTAPAPAHERIAASVIEAHQQPPSARSQDTAPLTDPAGSNRRQPELQSFDELVPPMLRSIALDDAAPRAGAAKREPSLAPGDDMHRYWGFRPAEESHHASQPAGAASRAAGRATSANSAPAIAAEPPPPRDILAELGSASVIASYAPSSEPASTSQSMGQPPRATSDGEAERIKGVIRKLADDINAGRRELPPPLPAPGPPVDTTSPQLVDPSVEALRAAAQSMRSAGERMTAAAQLGGPPALGARQQRLAEISEALAAQSIEVLLDPILGLVDQRAEHYEVTVRLRLASGDTLGPDEIVETCRGSGLLPLLDALSVERSARVARKMEERKKHGAVLSQLSAESLASDQFLNEFADTYRVIDTAAELLVLSFSQSDLRHVSETQWITLKDMADLGFRFAVEAVTDLDMDFEQLAASGFRFVKLDARVFLEGLATQAGFVPPHDICRHFAKLGFTLIVGHIEDERQLAQVTGFGAVLGQGQLFGAPRPVRADIVASRRLVAA